jgi:acid phosphatase type 7
VDHTNWTAYFDDLFAEYNVDLYFCGHTHNYQRTAPAARSKPSDPSCVSGSTYTGCKGTTFVVAGSPGCKEKLSTGTAPADVLLTHLQAYGYGKLTANATHLAWFWGETVAEDASTGELVRVAAPRTDSALFVRA